ncbi:MAG: RNA polymerase sigma factor FliA [bacterium]
MHTDLLKRLAYHLISRLPSNIQVEDLIQSGAIGLIEAAQKYDPTMGASFETYASIRVRGAMLDEVRRSDWTSRSVRHKMRTLSEGIRRVENKLGRSASSAEIATELGMDIESYNTLLKDSATSAIFSMDELMERNDNVGANMDENENPSQIMLDDHFQTALADVIEHLPERERLVMALYYDEELNLREIGDVLNVSESRVCQIHGQSLARIRTRMKEWL